MSWSEPYFNIWLSYFQVSFVRASCLLSFEPQYLCKYEYLSQCHQNYCRWNLRFTARMHAHSVNCTAADGVTAIRQVTVQVQSHEAVLLLITAEWTVGHHGTMHQHDAPRCTMMYHHASSCTMLHRVAPSYTLLHRASPCCTVMHCDVPVCIVMGMHRGVWVHTPRCITLTDNSNITAVHH